jgi:hypothetical protein
MIFWNSSIGHRMKHMTHIWVIFWLSCITKLGLILRLIDLVYYAVHVFLNRLYCFYLRNLKSALNVVPLEFLLLS